MQMISSMVLAALSEAPSVENCKYFAIKIIQLSLVKVEDEKVTGERDIDYIYLNPGQKTVTFNLFTFNFADFLA